MHKLSETDYLLSCLGEECGEVQQAVGKALRFGLDEFNPADGVSNFDQLQKEMHDVVAVFNLLCLKLEKEVALEVSVIEKKQVNLFSFMELSRKLGRLK